MLKFKFTLLLVIAFGVFMISSSGGRNGNFAGAPGDSGTGNCSNCHGGGTLDGNITLSNVPAAFAPNTTYNLTITLTDADAVEGGFQIVATQGSGNTPVGTFATTSGETRINNTTRLVHSTPKLFNGNPSVSWDISWTSPATTSTNQIQFYLAGNAVNGTGGTGGDAPYTTNTAVLPLPVELIAFYAGLNENKETVLVWETASELNNKGFEVEQSIDGKEWNNIGFVEGVGTTVEFQKYTFIAPVSTVKTYYRLKQIDFDDAFEYSKTITFEAKSEGNQFKIYPNPATNFINFENREAKNIRIINISGQTVFQSMELNQNQIDISRLEKGIYFIQIELINGERQMEKFVKI